MTDYTSYPKTPNLDKMLVATESGEPATIQKFLDWLHEDQGYSIVRLDDNYDPHLVSNMEKLMREFFGVDHDEANRERDAVHAWVVAQNESADAK